MRRPTPRRVAIAAAISLTIAFGAAALLQGYSGNEAISFLQHVAIFGGGLALLSWVAITIALRMAGWDEPTGEDEFEAIVQRSERLAAEGLEPEPDEEEFLALDPYDEDDFEALVADALDELPRDFQLVLKHVAVVVSDGGRKRGAYGLYHGDGVARDNVPDRIVIYRDTLRRDFGHDPDRLREEVTRTVLHELAHHLGWDEPGVRGLGL